MIDRCLTDRAPREQAVSAVEAAWDRAAARDPDPTPELLLEFAKASALIYAGDQASRLADVLGAATGDVR